MKVNISIDDISPHPQSSDKILNQCKKILEKFSDAKFTLFVPLAYWRTKGETKTSAPLRIDHFPDFCDRLKSLSKENYEIAFHGLCHGIPGKSNNDELQDVDYLDALEIIDMMYGIAKCANIFDDFQMILRPPAWRMSPGAFKACLDKGINFLALSSDDYAKATYNGADESELWRGKVNYYTCAPPVKPLILTEKTEIVYHACLWDKNALTNERVYELLQFLNSHKGKFTFSFIRDL